MTSSDLLRRALEIIPGGGQTDTKTTGYRLLGIQPSFFVQGRGSYAQDVEGHWWLDCQMGLAAYVLGYSDVAVNDAVRRQLEGGSLFSLSSPLEIDVAELLLGIFPEFDMARFAKNGSDVTSAAIRIARRATGRDHVIACGYHGFQDWSLAVRPSIGGIPAGVRILTHGNEEADVQHALQELDARPGEYAAVIVDTGGYGLPDIALMTKLQGRCRRSGTVFIMDEVVSGFRVGLRGAMGEYGIVPDLLCLGKAVANGFPLAVLMGSRRLMALTTEVGMSSTFGGDCIALAAAMATLAQLRDGTVNARIIERGSALMQAITSSIQRHSLGGKLRLIGYPALFDLTTMPGDPDRAAVVRHLMCALAERKVFWQESFVLCRDFGEAEGGAVASAVDAALARLRVILAERRLQETVDAISARERSYMDGLRGADAS